MENLVEDMQIESDKAVISKYEVLEAFFRTEDEENVNMANELNEIINEFYVKERQTRRNVTAMPFDLNQYKTAISYIRQVGVEY